jgi:predicted outer membrane repeat protein
MKTINIVVPVMILCFAACFTGSASCTTITVDWAGSGDEFNIQGGMSAANPGDTVLVLPGTYTGAGNRDLDCGGTNMVVLSTGGAAATLIDCESAGRGFFFDNCEDTTSVVKGFTIANAVADSGGGAFCIKGSNPRFENCVFLNNTATKRGGGLCCLDSSPIIRDCTFEGNLASDGGTGSAYGGGVACLGTSSPAIEDSHFEQNTAYLSGGGIHCYYASPAIARCEFVDNNLISYGSAGGGVTLAFADGTTISYCTFRENGTAQTITGAGIFADATSLTLTGCDFIENTAGVSSLRLVSGSSGTVSDCTFYGNISTWGYSTAGLSCFSGSNPTISNCTFAKNWGDHIECYESSPTIEYCIIAFSETGLPLICRQGTETPSVHHCFVYGNAGADTLCGGNHSDIENSDPLFCDMFNGDLRLCENSPCIAGATWPSHVGSEWEGCAPCGSAVRPESWGAIKAIYR